MNAFDNIEEKFRFRPISNSWIAIHPRATKVVQFIGGAFFGTFFPTFWYRNLLSNIYYEKEYTIVALPFGFSIRHWRQSLNLLIEQYRVRAEIIRSLKAQIEKLRFRSQIEGYRERQQAMEKNLETYQKDANYVWLGHSLGGKYIALLEILSIDDDLQVVLKRIEEALAPNKFIKYNIRSLEDKLKEAHEYWRNFKEEFGSEHPFIRNQPSLLLSPDLSGTKSIIPLLPRIRSIAKFIEEVVDAPGNEWGVVPTHMQTRHLIEYGNRTMDLFNLTSIISFEKDRVAGNAGDRIMPGTDEESDIFWLVQQLKDKLKLTDPDNRLHREIKKVGHFAPIGIDVLETRDVERSVLELLDRIQIKILNRIKTSKKLAKT